VIAGIDDAQSRRLLDVRRCYAEEPWRNRLELCEPT
jgi:hypothetical protein